MRGLFSCTALCLPGKGRWPPCAIHHRCAIIDRMRNEEFPGVLNAAPVIAAVKGREMLLRAVQTPVAAVFLLGGDLFTLPEMVRLAHAGGKLCFVHLDLIDGLGRDAAGVKWLARTVRPAGVLSTRPPLLKVAVQEGMRTVLRIFLIDSSSLETGVRMAAGCSPDLVEVMPGLVFRAIRALSARIDAPVIAGGMMEHAEDVKAALSAGAMAVSTSSEALWRREAWAAT